MQLLLSKDLHRLNKLYSRAIARVLPELRLEHYIELILLLAAANHEMTPKELSKLFMVDKSRIAVLIDNMMRDGYVYTESNPADRRNIFVFLTDKGKETIPKIREAISQVDDIVNRQLGKRQLKNFHDILFKMQTNLVNYME